jgi:hypothetical protein
MNSKNRSTGKTWAARAAAIGIIGAVALSGAAAVQAHDNGSGKMSGAGPLSALVTSGTITSSDADAVKSALTTERDKNRDAHQAEMKADRDAALAALVSAGKLTQAKADAVKASDARGLRDLVRNGTLTSADVAAIKEALESGHEAAKTQHQAEMKADREAALAALVTAGTLTQAKADAVAAALDAAPSRGGKAGMQGGKHGGKNGGKHGGMQGGMQGGRS